MYHLQHGQLYLSQAKVSPFAIKPMLLFYGLSQLLKACLIVHDPEYPASSSVLAHGLSTRKRKKQGYSFLTDEVKVQREGLYPHLLLKMFHMKHYELDDKYSMIKLLKQLPEMADPIHYLSNKTVFVSGSKSEKAIQFHSSISTNTTLLNVSNFITIIFLTEKRLLTKTETHLLLTTSSHARFSAPSPIRMNQEGLPVLHSNRSDFLLLPELAVYYLILYNLSMICRYETEWWGERLHTMDCDDVPYIKHFLTIAEDRTQLLIINELLNK
ncbi:LOW QUALITY PROTEIN: YaaC protein [Bacillus sp. JCM 19045]|nr:LOW QUALITY PROTEIN: YaaC protein [Bacillus sp. JCM 19045]